MSKKNKKKLLSKRRTARENEGITEITVSGYKSIRESKSIKIKPLTLLAGTNSSGKSSFIQPLLMMKQTLEEGFDPGPLLLNGAHVRFTSADQLLHTNFNGKKEEQFQVGFEINNEDRCDVTYRKVSNGFTIDKTYYKVTELDENYKKQETEITLHKDEMRKDIKSIIPPYLSDLMKKMDGGLQASVVRNRCFLKANIHLGNDKNLVFTEFPSQTFDRAIRNILHLPGLRGNPERTYPTTAVDSDFENTYLPGNFEKYVASLINKWQTNDEIKLSELGNYLSLLGLTDKVRTTRIDDTQVSINVGRGVKDSLNDLVNIADVGLGVSQTLPVLVALVYARPGQMVYIEQPEIHLHPRAQYMFASILSKIISKGVKVVMETHSSLIIKGIQTAVAKNEINNKDAALHWFSRNKDFGETEIISSNLDSNGAFGDWPIDFDEVELMAEINYLDAAEED
ncbi:AAA family ATPase [Peribacillus loiseleuriae]|uniref:Uncharacterized protein n=1 Tax=Peribacillus loiseleuriae TaxID=1679170 RepID=A0A0K9GS90_9BACI|nr:AAA family ATPase [Peribacillus loiseleuriae]KMY49554.1 hypothetical protein AC625_08345 [Peribacillus loiseleuriae]